MPRHDDDDIELIGGLSVDREDAAIRQRVKRDGSEKTGTASIDEQTSHLPPPERTTLTLSTWVLGGLLVAMLGVCGWLGLEMVYMQEQFIKAQSELEWARNRVEALGRKVHVTGTSMTETGDTIEKKFKFFDSEIRKLWGVSNDRNKKAIRANKGQITALSGTLKTTLDESQKTLKKLTGSQQTLEQNLKQVNSENTALRASLEDHSEQLMLVRGELDLALQRLNAVPPDMAKRVAGNEEAIEAIDAARRQLVSNITKLQQRVNQLQLSNGVAVP